MRLLGAGDVHAPVTNNGTIQAVSTSNVISQDITNALDATLRVGDNNTTTNLTTARIDNSGTVQLDFNAALIADQVNNLASGRLESIGGATNTLTANLTNDGVVLVEEDLTLNRAEALYVDTLIVGTGATLDAAGINVYYKSLVGTFPLNAGPGSGRVAPEPGMMLLLAVGGACVLGRQRARRMRRDRGSTLIVLLSLVLLPGVAWAQTHTATWVGPGPGTWLDGTGTLWNIAPAGGVNPFPLNAAGETFAVLVPAGSPVQIDTGDITVDRVDIAGGQSLEIFEGWDLTLQETILDALTNNGTLVLNGNGSILTAAMTPIMNLPTGLIEVNPGTTSVFSALSGTLGNTGQVDVLGDGVNQTTLTLTDAFNNDGTFRLRASATISSVGGFTNNGTLESAVGPGAAENVIQADLVNLGPAPAGPTVVVNHPLLISQTTGTHSNAGTFNLNSGRLDFAGANSSFTNTGNFTLLAGSELNVPGTLSFNQNGGTFDCQAGATLTISGTFTVNGGTFLNPCNINVMGGSFLFTAGTLSNFANCLTFTVPQTVNFPIDNFECIEVLANVTGVGLWNNFAPNGLISVGDDSALDTLTLNQNFTNGGEVELLGRATLSIPAGDFTNDGSFFSQGVAFGNTLSARLINNNTATILNPLTLSRSNVIHTNPGMFSIEASDLIFSGSNIQWTNTGTLELTTGGAGWTITSGQFQNQSTGAVTGAADTAITLSSATLTRAAGDVFDHFGDMSLSFSTFAGNYVNRAALSLSSSDINGELANLASGTVDLLGASNVESTLSNAGLLRATGTNTVSASLTDHTNTGELIVGNNSTTSNLTVGGTLFNTGTISLDFNATYQGDVIENGDLANTNGVIRTLHGPGNNVNVELSNFGDVLVDHDLTINKSLAQHSNFGTGRVLVRGGDLTLSGTDQNFDTSGIFRLNAPHTLTISQGGFRNLGGDFAGQTDSSLIVQSSATMTLAGGIFDHQGNLAIEPGATLDALGSDYTNHQLMTLRGQFSGNLPAVFTSGLDHDCINAAGGELLMQGLTTISAIVRNLAGAQMTATSTSNSVTKQFFNTGTLTIGDNATTSRLDVVAVLQNDGVIELNGVATLGGSDRLINNGLLTTIGGLNNVLISQLDVTTNGQVILNKPLTVDLALTTHQNAGLIDAGAADLTLSGSNHLFNNLAGGTIEFGATRSHTMTGTGRFDQLDGIINVGDGTTLSLLSGYDMVLSGGTFNGTATAVFSLAGAFSDTTELEVTGGSVFNFVGDMHLSRANLRASTYTNQGLMTLVTSSDFIGDELVNNADLELNGSVDIITANVLRNLATMRVTGTANTVNNELRNTGTLTVGDNLSTSALSVSLLTNEGTLRLSRRATINGSGSDLLANNAGAVLEINDGGFNVLNININNATGAQIVVNEDVTINHVGDPLGCEDNFELETLRLGPGAHVTLQDVVNNGNTGGPFGAAEALYVDTLILDSLAELNLNGLHLYFNNFQGTLNQIVDNPGAAPCITTAPRSVPAHDLDGDGDVDLIDYGSFNPCITGPGGGVLPGCACSDADGDNDVDSADFAAFQLAFTG